MKILEATSIAVGIPFREQISHQLKARKQTASFVVQITTTSGILGYGEGAPRDYVTGETMAGLQTAAASVLPTLAGLSFKTIEAIGRYTASLRKSYGPSLTCAVELALLDALGKKQGLSLSTYLPTYQGAPPTYSGILPYVSLEKLPRWLELIGSLKLKALKIKVGQEDDVERLRLVRETLGNKLDVRLDANRAWSTTEATARIEAMLPFKPSWIEEPLQPSDIADLPDLANNCPLPILLDESVTTLTDAAYYANEITAGQACINLKLSKMGGPLSTAAIHQFASKNGIPCQLGCHVGETAILTAAGRHFALSHSLRYLEGAYAPFFMSDDLGETPISFTSGGAVVPLAGPGLGISIETEKLPRYRAMDTAPVTQ